jgi:hypothetical protein
MRASREWQSTVQARLHTSPSVRCADRRITNDTVLRPKHMMEWDAIQRTTCSNQHCPLNFALPNKVLWMCIHDSSKDRAAERHDICLCESIFLQRRSD